MSYCTPEEAAQLDSSLVAKDDITPEMLQWAAGQIDRHLGKTYASDVEVTEKVDGEGAATVRVSHSPVTAVSAILIEGTTQPAADWVWYEDGRISLQPLPVEFGVAQPVWPAGRQNVQVTYRYGLASGVKVPPDVQFAAAQLTALMAKYAKKGLLGPVSEDWTVGAVTIKVKANAELSAAIQEVLEATLGPPPPGIW